MIGDGHKARIRAARVCSRRSDTPAKPGDAWGPNVSATRGYGTASPRDVLPGTYLPGEEVSTDYATVVGGLKQPTPRGQPVAMRTCAQTCGR
jgi:hypothetical protein